VDGAAPEVDVHLRTLRAGRADWPSGRAVVIALCIRSACAALDAAGTPRCMRESPGPMNTADFVRKWRAAELTERSAAQQHFLDLCAVLDHPTPAAADPIGADFTFERGVSKVDGGDGWADVWKRGFFGWEYKGKHKDLDAAYRQLLQYRESLESPPLLVVSDMERIVIRTNFTNTPTHTHTITIDDLEKPGALERLRAVFYEPDRLRPGRTSEAITQEAAERITDVAEALRSRGFAPQAVARFLDRIVFCLFAEDVGLLSEKLFSRLVEKSHHDPERFGHLLQQLFAAMAHGGDFGADTILYFNGDLFADVDVLPLTLGEVARVREVAKLDWAAVDPSIFGTLFQRALDPDKRAQLGAHYTSREDIETIVDPVVVWPLRREWEQVQEQTLKVLARRSAKSAEQKAARGLLRKFLERLQHVSVLDPACGSGNFLYVVLHKLKDLEKEAILFGMDNGIPGFLPHVGPWQLHGIEINAYAFELAQMTVWIGWLQWIRANGFGQPSEPILQKLTTFENRDAIMAFDGDSPVGEPAWPAVDFIVSNPPFLGGKKMRTGLGDSYLDALFGLWGDRVPPEADLCCYWFEKARHQIEIGACKRAGLLATQGIRGGANREVLKRIKESGDIFFAESDRPWVLEGAHVHVSMVGFDDGTETRRILDGERVPAIHANLTGDLDLTGAVRLRPNIGEAFMGDTKGGAFDIDEDTAIRFLREPNPHGLPNSDVIVPWVNGMDLTRRSRRMWIVDFGVQMSEHDAARYQAPFEYVRQHVRPERQKNKRKNYKERWWIHVEARPGMRQALAPLPRFLATTTVSKHRLFDWITAPTVPDHQLIVFAVADDAMFGILHSRVHELWARAQGTQVREVESGFRYTPTSCFETFPLPDMSAAQRDRIAATACKLNALRTRWLNPPEWLREEVLEFPATVNGPWRAVIRDPDPAGVGAARYVRLVPRDDDGERQIKKRTLTNLYNELPAWLVAAHRALDDAVLAAYGWSADSTDSFILRALSELNGARGAANGGKSSSINSF
jgi:type II restriction/modification system DNA methylase subunit YeeA